MFVPRLISSAVARPHGGIRGGVYLRCCSLPTMDQPLPLAPGVAPTPSWAIKVSGEMISSYRKPQRRLLSTNVNQVGLQIPHRLLAIIPIWAPATGPLAGRQRRVPAEGCRPSAFRGSRAPRREPKRCTHAAHSYATPTGPATKASCNTHEAEG
jgi:hypothetical protein